ncbi:LCP family protein [Paucisalibacillus sp. EB02]|uniref:LCP family protein n=1 Tax=Paucisalibacillus sp. EB02 TaxID=1347087 RepID=UPI0004B16D14|nr:LCP family protein [Paucisalibacillus sp. EB02]
MFQKKPENVKTKDPISKKKKIWLTILLSLSSIVFAITIYGVYLYSKAEAVVQDSYEEIERGTSENNAASNLREEAVNPIEDNVSILIIGVDDSAKRGFEEKSRSDVLILATFNKEQGNVKLVSIPRDTHTFVPEINAYTKINHAHFHGGPKASIETVENFLNVPVDYYIRLNFEAFIQVVETLDGVYYDVPFELYEMDSKDRANAIHLNAGYQKLTGEEALALARTRKYDSDIERGQRQQELIKSIVKRTASISSLFKLGDLIEAVGNNMITNLQFDEMRSFLSYGLKQNLAIQSITLEGNGGYMDDGLWYYQVHEDSRLAVEKELREHMDLPIDTDRYPNASMELNSSGNYLKE